MDSVIHMIDQSSINLFTENDATNIPVDTLESLYTESKLPPWNGQNMTCMNGITVKNLHYLQHILIVLVHTVPGINGCQTSFSVVRNIHVYKFNVYTTRK